MNQYRTNVEVAIKYFRPILSALKIRERDKQDLVYLANFDHLDLLNLDNVVITVLLADLDTTEGMFFCREENSYFHCYIVINNKLYDKKLITKVKVAGIHEFCHFMAVIYTLTITSIESQKQNLQNRIKQKVDELSSESLNRLYSVLSNSPIIAKEECNSGNESIPELDDSHFRLNCEGSTIDYDILFKNFLISKELFEQYFDKAKQNTFRDLMNSKEKKDNETAYLLWENCLKDISNTKSIPIRFAFEMTIPWIKSYLFNKE